MDVDDLQSIKRPEHLGLELALLFGEGRHWSGWLIFDCEHRELMFDSANPNKPRVRRGTLWEIHRITKFKVKIDGVWKIL